MKIIEKAKGLRKGRLPLEPSKLIRLALKDLASVEKLPQYDVDMSIWHVPTTCDICAVCFAGAIMACTLEFKPSHAVHPGLLNHSDGRALLALEKFRIGCLSSAFELLDIPQPAGLIERVFIEDYHCTPSKFKRQMRSLATALEKLGY